MQIAMHPELGLIQTVRRSVYDKWKFVLPTMQRRWDTECIARYEAGLLGGLSALTPCIVLFTLHGKRLARHTLLVSGVTAGSDPALAICAELMAKGLPARYDSTMVEDMAMEEMQRRASLEIAALRVRLDRPQAPSASYVAMLAH